MDKFYRSLEWLNDKQAVDWLQSLIKEPITRAGLLRLCEEKLCFAYVTAAGLLKGHAEFCDNVTAKGFQLVKNPMTLLYEEPCLSLCGDVVCNNSLEGNSYFKEATDWVAFEDLMFLSTHFKSADIQALAKKMNGAAEQQNDSAAELEHLRQQLEQERLGRNLAEDESLELRDDLEKERAARRSAVQRAERSETAAAYLRQNQKAEDEKPLDTRERSSLERLLYVLAKHAKFTLIAPYSDETAIQKTAAMLGAKVPTGKGAIAKYLTAAVARAELDRKG